MSEDLSVRCTNREVFKLVLGNTDIRELMRTSCHRPGAGSIEYTSGGDALVFYGFRLDLFQALLIADVFSFIYVLFICVLLWTFSTTSVIS